MINIAVDGPAGAGKSYLARQIAKRLGYIYVDTGALYRSVALYFKQNDISINDNLSWASVFSDIKLELQYAEDGVQHVFLNDKDVSTEIRQPEISKAASAVSAIPEVRTFLFDIQRDMAKSNNVVMDGRDIGTVIMPNAQVKIFLCANEHARAKRRFLELSEKGIVTTVEEVEQDMKERDHSDSTRKIAPAIPASDAVILDNSDLDREGTVEAALNIIADKLK